MVYVQLQKIKEGCFHLDWEKKYSHKACHQIEKGNDRRLIDWLQNFIESKMYKSTRLEQDVLLALDERTCNG